MIIKYSNQTDRAGEPLERRFYSDNGRVILERHRKDSSGEWVLYGKKKTPGLRKRAMNKVKGLNWKQNDNQKAVELKNKLNKKCLIFRVFKGIRTNLKQIIFKLIF